MCWGAVWPVLYFQVSAFRGSSALPTMYPLQGSEELALQPVPLEAHQNTVTMDTNLTGERSEKCVCVRGEREGERVKTGLCVCVWGEGVCRCSLHVFLSATLKARKITLKLAHLPILLLLKTSPNFGNTQMLPLTSRFQLSAWLTASNLIRWKTLTTNRKRSAACFHGRPREAMPSR